MKIIDFGLARDIEGEKDVPISVVGTPEFMPPEVGLSAARAKSRRGFLVTRGGISCCSRGIRHLIVHSKKEPNCL